MENFGKKIGIKTFLSVFGWVGRKENKLWGPNVFFPNLQKKFLSKMERKLKREIGHYFWTKIPMWIAHGLYPFCFSSSTLPFFFLDVACLFFFFLFSFDWLGRHRLPLLLFLFFFYFFSFDLLGRLVQYSFFSFFFLFLLLSFVFFSFFFGLDVIF